MAFSHFRAALLQDPPIQTLQTITKVRISRVAFVNLQPRTWKRQTPHINTQKSSSLARCAARKSKHLIKSSFQLTPFQHTLTHPPSRLLLPKSLNKFDKLSTNGGNGSL